MFRRLWWQHPSLHQTKGPARKPISGTPPPLLRRAPMPSPHRKAIFGPPSGGPSWEACGPYRGAGHEGGHTRGRHTPAPRPAGPEGCPPHRRRAAAPEAEGSSLSQTVELDLRERARRGGPRRGAPGQSRGEGGGGWGAFERAARLRGTGSTAAVGRPWVRPRRAEGDVAWANIRRVEGGGSGTQKFVYQK